MFIASSIPTVFMDFIPGGGSRFGVFVCGILTSFSIAFIFFQLIYLIIPNKKMTINKTWCGALIAAIALEIFIILFPLYVKQCMGSYTGIYNNFFLFFYFLLINLGLIGFIIILILFFYYFAIILIIGAQINAHFFERYPQLYNVFRKYLTQTPMNNIRMMKL